MRIHDIDTESEKDWAVADLPESMAWVTQDGTAVPVARIETRQRGEGKEVKKFGVDGALRESTVMVPRRR